LSLQDVEQKVLASAQQEAKEIVEAAEAAAKETLDRRTAALRDAQASKIQLAKAQVDSDLERAVNTRRAENGMKVLEAKNQAIDAVFAQAAERIVGSQGFDYAAWIGRQVRLAVEKGEGVLSCSARDRQSVEGALHGTAAQNVTLSPENGSMQGGVLLEGPAFDLDLTLDSALDDLREELAVDLAAKLFANVAKPASSPADEE